MHPPQLFPQRLRQHRMWVRNPQFRVAVHTADIDIGGAEQGINVIHQQQF